MCNYITDGRRYEKSVDLGRGGIRIKKKTNKQITKLQQTKYTPKDQSKTSKKITLLQNTTEASSIK